MFWNNYKYKLLRTVKDITCLGWTLLLPLILATLFSFTFSSLDTQNKFSSIPLAVVADAAYDNDFIFKATIENLSGDDEDAMFITEFTDEASASELLKKGEVEGYIKICNDKPALFVTNNGLNQTIIKAFLDEYLQLKSSIETIAAANPEAAMELAKGYDFSEITTQISITANPQSDSVNYFYALLAMTCMYGGLQGMQTITFLQANLSAIGQRRSISASKRSILVLSDLLGGVTIQFFILVLITFYLKYIIGVSFGDRIGYILLTCLAGSFTGFSFGSLVAASNKLKENAKSAIIIVVSMIFSFLSGLMVQNVNYTVMQKSPFIAWINPAARITDAFYCLYYYDTLSRYFKNILIITAMGLVMFILTILFVRRQRYESI